MPSFVNLQEKQYNLNHANNVFSDSLSDGTQQLLDNSFQAITYTHTNHKINNIKEKCMQFF